MVALSLGLLLAPIASASTTDPLDGCGAFADVIVMPDGDYVALGKVSGCPAPGGTPNSSRVVLMRLNPDGTRDTAFGKNGGAVVATSGDTYGTGTVHADGDKVITHTDQVLTRFNRDGSIDTSFADDGSIEPPFDGSVFYTTAVAVQLDGRIIVGGTGDAALPRLIRYDVDGDIDPGFGGGLAEPPVPAAVGTFNEISQIAFDDQGKVLVAGESGPDDADFRKFTVMRLTPTGDLDTSFGQGGTGFGLTSGQVYRWGGAIRQIHPIGLEVDDRISISWSVTEPVGKSVAHRTETASLDGDGISVPGTGGAGPVVLTDAVQLPGGNLAGAGYLNNFYPYANGPLPPNQFMIARFSSSGGGAFSDGRSSSIIEAAPGGGALSGLAFDPSSNSLIAVGGTGWTECAQGICENRQATAVLKTDAVTGELDSGFGVGGIVMTPRNVCAGRIAESQPGAAVLPWNRCILSKPALSAKARFIRGASRRPGLKLSAQLDDPPLLPTLMRRKLHLRIPDRMSFSRGKVRVQARAYTSDPLEPVPVSQISTSRSGRVISVGFFPSEIYDLDNGYSSYPPNTEVSFEVTVKRGSLRPLSRKARRAKLVFRVRAANVGSRWYGNGTSSKVVRARPPAAGRR